MRYTCLVSKSSTRNPSVFKVDADDEAEAAFFCWQQGGWNGCPFVHSRAEGRWVVTDGHCTANVQVIGVE